VTFDEISEDFLGIVGEVAWATVATVDTRGRPRTRVLHPYWEVVDGQPVGWIGTSRSPLKTKHLEANPHVSVSYWSPKQETVYADCRAEWADEERERVWQLYPDAEPPLGYDPGALPALEGRAAGRCLRGAAPGSVARHGPHRGSRRDGALLRRRVD
jgi:uncharacterized pyridoxamine 5'-phosphate oxidase family protein